MYTVDEYLDMLRSNLMKQTNRLVKEIESLQSIDFAKEVTVLFIESMIGESELSFDLTTREDMFNCLEIEEVGEGFAGGLDLVDEFLFDEWEDKDIDFYIENDLEDAAIAEIASWVQCCFDQVKVEILSLPLYFAIHDEEFVLDLKRGEWVDPEEVQL